MGLTYTFLPAPTFYSGTALGAVDNPPNTVAINDHVYSIDLQGYSHASLPAFRQGVVTSGEVSDQLFNPDGGWWRYRFNWNAGAGQQLVDLDDDTIGARFESSSNVNVWTRNELTLSNDLAEVTAIGTQGFVNPIRRFDGKLYTFETVGGNDDIYSSPLGNTWTAESFTNVAGLNYPLQDFYYIPNDADTPLWTIDSNNDLHYTTASTATALVHNGTDAGNLSLVNNNLLFSDANKLYELLPSGSTYTAEEIFSHFDPEFRFTFIINVGSRVYVGGADEDRTYVYAMTATSTGRLAVAQQVADFPLGERITGALSYAGNIVLYGNKGLRLATVTGDGSLTYGKRIAPLDYTNVVDVVAHNNFVYATLENNEGIKVARLDLETFTDSLTPAFALDIEKTNGGDYGRQVLLGEQVSLGVYSSNILVRDSDQLFYTSGYATQGELFTGDIFFGTAEPKSLGKIEVRFDGLASTESVKAQFFDADDDTELVSQTLSTPGSNSLEINASGAVFNRGYLKLTLTGDGTSTPRVTQWKARAYPIAPTVERWQVPLLISGSVLHGDGQGQVKTFNPWNELEYLRSLWESRTIVSYKEGIHAYRVRIDNFLVEPTKWDDSGAWLEVRVTTQLLTVE